MKHLNQEIFNDGTLTITGHADAPDDAKLVSKPNTGQFAWTQNSTATTNWPDNALRALSRLDPGPPPRRPTPATDQAIAFYQAIGDIDPHKFRWVMSPDYAEQLDREQDRPPDQKPPKIDTSTVVALFGMPIRLDEHATTLMLELR